MSYHEGSKWQEMQEDKKRANDQYNKTPQKSDGKSPEERLKMTKEELIAQQQLQIEHLKLLLKENEKIVRDLTLKLIGGGQPLNDNCLGFTNEQIKWCFKVKELVEQINYLKK